MNKFIMPNGFARCYVCKKSKRNRFFSNAMLKKRNKTVSTVCRVCWNTYLRAYYRRKRKEVLDSRFAVYRLSPEKTKYFNLKRRSITKGWPFLITRSEFNDWFQKSEKKCFYCDLVDLTLLDSIFREESIHLSIDRMNNSLPYIIENMCLACDTCNTLKRDFFSSDEFREIAQKYIKPRWMAKIEKVIA